MDGPILRRATACIAVGWTIVVYGMRLAHGQIGSPPIFRPEIPLVLLDAELLRCAELDPDAVMDPVCEAAWAQSRSRVLEPDSSEDFPAACNPGTSLRATEP
jgi:conjugative transfer region protein TrbK